MATNLLPIGNTRTTSAEFILTESTAVFMSVPGGGKAPPHARLEIYTKASTGGLSLFAVLTGANPGGVLPPGTYVVTRDGSGGVIANIGLEKA